MSCKDKWSTYSNQTLIYSTVNTKYKTWKLTDTARKWQEREAVTVKCIYILLSDNEYAGTYILSYELLSSRQSGGLSLAKILWQQWQYIINSQEYCQLKKWTIVGYYYDPLCKCTLALNKRQCAHMLKTCVYCTVHPNQKYLTKTSFKNLIKTKLYSASTSQANQRHMVA